MKEPSISGRLVRSSLRYLRDREGAATIAAIAQQFPQHAFLQRRTSTMAGSRPAPGSRCWRPFEQRIGDPPTLRLLREMTRATMAAAVSTAFLFTELLDKIRATSASPGINLSASAGVAVFPDHGADMATLTAAADWALHAAKALGRDRAVIYSPEVTNVLGAVMEDGTSRRRRILRRC